MIKAIIFDCFGVIAVDGWTPFKEKYFGNSSKLLAEATELNHQTDGGLLSYADYVNKISQMAGVEPAEFRRKIEQTAIDERLLDFIANELKPKYKIGLLSNVASDWLADELGESKLKMFDSVCLSSQTGLVKPDEKAYQDILSKLGVQPDEAVFTDDQTAYCQAASKLGIKAIVYKSFKQFTDELSHIMDMV